MNHIAVEKLAIELLEKQIFQYIHIFTSKPYEAKRS